MKFENEEILSRRRETVEKKQAAKTVGKLRKGVERAFNPQPEPPGKPEKGAKPSKKIEPTDEGKVIKRKLRK
jgi:hypothetical protein